MIILLVASAILVVGIVVLNFAGYGYAELGVALIAIGCIALLLFFILLPLSYYSGVAKIRRYNSVRSTIEVARSSGIEIESAALVLKIVEMNEWVTGVRYWNGTILDIFIPDAVDSLVLLK